MATARTPVRGFDDRWSSTVYTVCERPEEMWAALRDDKDGERSDSAEVLGRLLAGYLADRQSSPRSPRGRCGPR